jgi:hypothetical protein
MIFVHDDAVFIVAVFILVALVHNEYVRLKVFHQTRGDPFSLAWRNNGKVFFD